MLTAVVNKLARMETMGHRIAMLRQARGLSVPELADKVGVTRALVWQWEQDMVKGIRPENFIRLCHALGVTGEYLVWGPNQPTSADLDVKPKPPKSRGV
jgi:transcriptional regulator with XRE-family HTH domain